MWLQGLEVEEVREFKYQESTVESSEEAGREVKKRVQAGRLEKSIRSDL